MKKLKKLAITTILLTLTSFFMKTVAVSFNVYLTDRLGSAGIGLFQLITSVYMLFKTISISGMTLAATRMVIDDPSGTVPNMKKLLICGLSVGFFACIAMFSLSDICADKWLFNTDASLSLKILALSLPFISLSAVFSGYFTAIRKMARYSAVQIIEQTARILVAVICLNRLIRYGLKYAICGIVIGIAFSEIVSFSLCLSIYQYDKRKMSAPEKKPRFFKKFIRIALPESIGAFLRSGLNTIQHLLVPQSLKKSGASANEALSSYGVIQGMALPILLYPSSLLTVLSGLLIPEVAECSRKNNKPEINYIVKRVLGVTFIFSVLTTGIMFGFSDQLSQAIYKTSEASEYLMLIAPLVPIMYVDMATDGMLKGLDEQFEIMKINILDSLTCVLLVMFLVPKAALAGYIFTIYAGEVLNFILSYRRLKKRCDFRLNIKKSIILPGIEILTAVHISKLIFSFTDKTNEPFILVLMILTALAAALIMMVATRCITRDDYKWIKTVFRND